jgi:hypothetical protein
MLNLLCISKRFKRIQTLASNQTEKRVPPVRAGLRAVPYLPLFVEIDKSLASLSLCDSNALGIGSRTGSSTPAGLTQNMT